MPGIFGRPNITGRLSYLASNDERALPYEESALYYPITDGHTQSDFTMVDETIPADIGLDANRHDAIYGASNTVQPHALRTLVLIRAF